MRVRAYTFALCGLLCVSCASGPPEFLWRPKTRIGWPPLADPPRIEVVLAYHGTGDVERNPGLFARILNFFAGESSEQIISPYGLAATSDERVLVADAGRHVVHALSLRTGEHETWAGSGELTLDTPIGVAVVPGTGVFVTDSQKGRIVVFSTDGDPLRSVGTPEQLGRPTGIAYDSHGDRLLVCDTTGSRIIVYRPDGTLLGSYGARGDAPGEFNYPTNVALTSDGRIVVTDSMNFRVQVLSAAFEPVSSFGIVGRGPGTFASPKGVALDSEDHIYVVDAMFDNVQIFDLEGRLLLTFATRGTGLGNLYLPSGILIDGKDRVFVADGGNARIQVFQYHGRGEGQ